MVFKKILAALMVISGQMAGQTAGEIIERAEDLIKGKTAHGIIEMTVVTPDYERTLRMESWWEGNEKALIVIHSPRKEKGNKTLKIGNEMWNYLRNTETTIKIPPSMMLQSWNGSDFTNDDLVRESNLSEDYFQTLEGEEKLNDELCWKIILEPKPDAPVVWGKLIYWVRKDSYIPARVEFYDEKDKLMRFMNFSDVKKFGNRLVPSIWEMVNITKEGNLTKLKLIDMEFNIKISDRIFSFQELEQGK
ncbi:MAG: outer membrane lipoprotein-sorting protein [Melioribacteraceae bacterium]|nr:outer membrane lipoprotein-sorting protein [Melioribacteraceae bacterium]